MLPLNEPESDSSESERESHDGTDERKSSDDGHEAVADLVRQQEKDFATLFDFSESEKLPTLKRNIQLLDIVKEGSAVYQNKSGPYERRYGRSPENWFTKTIGKTCGAEMVTRKWLVYSPSMNSLYCFCCMLHQSDSNISAFERREGMTDWKHSYRCADHEKSTRHRRSFLR